MKEIQIYTDGACKGNPGPGGWGAVLKYNDYRKELSGFVPDTTNNRMEILAVIKALLELKKSCVVNIFSDSQYVCNAVNKGWAKKWQKNNWMKNKKEKALNTDLWEEFLKLSKNHKISFTWVRGHNGNEENERCDRLAVLAIEKNIRV
ncbi:MAG: ribonuclease HI [Oscillospiraceae bacterium]|nr:ribonuclease HI [Oscillospiraceae bacterium]